MARFSLKYRIAVVIFALEAVVISLTLVTTLKSNTESSRVQFGNSERVLLSLLSDLSRIALITAEFDELQPYVEQVVSDPHVVKVLLIDRNERVVVSSDVADIGAVLPALRDTPERFWKTQEIDNASGRMGMLAINFSHAELLEANSDALDVGIAIGLSGMTFIAVVGVLIGHLLTRRLSILAATARRFAEGDLSAKTNFVGSDEVAMVGRTFDEMARSIEHQIASLHATGLELRQARQDLERRVAERTAELAVARDHALEASRTKSAFLANMSHELRTPLNAIIGYSELLAEDAASAGISSFVTDLNKIHAASSHLLALINGILDLSKIEAGKTELILSDFEVAPLIHDAVNAAHPIIAKNNNALSVHCDENLGTMRADAVKVRQSLINLLSNAGKFTDSGSIHVHAVRTGEPGSERVEIAVRDTGIGIAPEQLSKLFSDFYQVDTSTTRKYGGSGLGLAISRRFCQMMGGDIRVESTLDGGSTFTLTLPVDVKPPLPIAPPEKQGDHPVAEIPDPREIRLNTAALPPAVTENRRKKLPTVLVVDDDPSARDLMLRLLTRQGFAVEFGRNGSEALEVARAIKPDVITLDVIMPGKNGWEVLQELKKDPETAHIPVIMLTMTDEKVASSSLGAAHFLSKPLDRTSFMDVLVRSLRKSA